MTKKKNKLVLVSRRIIPKDEYTSQQLYNLPSSKWVLVKETFSGGMGQIYWRNPDFVIIV